MEVVDYVLLEEKIELAFAKVLERHLPGRPLDLRTRAARRAAQAVTMKLIYADHYKRGDDAD